MTHGHKALDLWEVKCEGELFLIIVIHHHRGYILNFWTAWERVGYGWMYEIKTLVSGPNSRSKVKLLARV